MGARRAHADRSRGAARQRGRDPRAAPLDRRLRRAAARAARIGERIDAIETESIVAELVDPATIHACRDPALRARIVRLAPGELLCAEGEHSDCAFLLLRGAILVERRGETLARVSREGEILGELEALTGRDPQLLALRRRPDLGLRPQRRAVRAARVGAPRARVRLMRAMAERYAP